MSTPLSAAIFLSASQLHIETILHVKVGGKSRTAFGCLAGGSIGYPSTGHVSRIRLKCSYLTRNGIHPQNVVGTPEIHSSFHAHTCLALSQWIPAKFQGIRATIALDQKDRNR
jgi:hypothetical protein